MPDTLTDLGFVPDHADLGFVPDVVPTVSSPPIKRLGAEGGLLAGMVPGERVPGAEAAKSVVLNSVGAQGGPIGAAQGMVGNAVDQLTRPGNQPFKWGEMFGMGLLRAIPGESLAGAALPTVAKAAAKYGLGNVAAQQIEKGLDDKRWITPAEAGLALGVGAGATFAGKAVDTGAGKTTVDELAAKHAVEDATLREGQAAGYLVPPADINPSAANKVISSAPGKAAIRQEVIQKNQETTTALAAQAIGLNPKQDITKTAVLAARKEAGKPYEQLAAISPQAAKDLESLKQATHDGNDLMKKYGRSADPADRKAAEAEFANADRYETKLEAHATKAGMPELIPQLAAAKKAIAKTYVVENALNEATGQVSAAHIGSLFAKGAPLTEELATIGRFQQAFPRYTADAEKTAKAGVSKMSLFGGVAGGAAAGGHFLGTPGAIAGGALGALLPAAENVPSKILLSPMWQRNFAQPFYGNVPPDIQATLARLAAQNAGNQVNPSFLQQVATP